MSEQVTDFQSSKRSSVGSQDVESVIGPTLVIKGEVSAEEDLLIMGRVEGKIDHNQRLTIHTEGSVKATIKAKEIQIEGTVEGDIYGTERVTICETGRVVGNVYAPRVGLTEGAAFKGMVDMDSDAAAIESRYAEQTTNKKPTTQAEKPVQLAELTAPEETPKAAKAASRSSNGKKKASKPSTTAGAELDESEEKTAADAVSEASDE